MFGQSQAAGSTTPAWVPVAIAAIGVAGAVVGAMVNWVLSSTTGRRSEVREVRLQLIDTRDLVWDGWPAVDRHTAKLRTRLHTLGMPRNCLDAVRDSARAAAGSVQTAAELGLDEGDGVPPEAKTISSSDVAMLDGALEELDLRLARMGRLVRPRRSRR